MRTKRTGGTPGRRALSVLLSLALCLSLLPGVALAAETTVGDFTLTSSAALTAGTEAGENDYYYDEANSTLYLHTNTPVTVSNTDSAATSTQNITVQAPSGGTEDYTPQITLNGVHTSGTFTAGTDSRIVFPLALTVTGTNDLGQVLLWNYSSAGSNRATVTIGGAGTLNTSYLRARIPVSSTTLTGITLNGGSINVDSELEITGCTVMAASIYGNAVSISGGSVTSTGAGGYGIYGGSGVTISGDAVVNATGGLVVTNPFTGSTSAQAGIGVGSSQTITIKDSARVTAKGSPAPASIYQTSGAPGIGTISNPNGSVPSLTSNIIIQGNASVTATGTKYAAGIGAGVWNTANITIEDNPTITAQGGENGAGIGLGRNYSNSARATIDISGTPRIDAQAGPDGASGIGLGEGDATVNVTITGGSFAQGDISAQTVGGQEVPTGYYVDTGSDKEFPYVVREATEPVLVPKTVTLQMGKTQQFTLVGAASDANVTWSVSDNTDTNTQISGTGRLTLGMNETAGSTLTVTATVDSDEYTAQVTVTEPEYTVTFAPGEGGSGTADPAKVSRNDTGTFTYTLPGVGAEEGQINFTAPAGMHFAGWHVSGGTTSVGQTLAAGTVITLTGDVTLTANWAVTPVVTLYGVELENGDSGTGYSYSYDSATGVSTLTLNGYRGSGSVSGEDVDPGEYYAALYCNHDLVLVLNGTNSLTLTGPGSGVTDFDGNGIAVLGSLTIRDGSSEETGSLSVNVENFVGSQAITCEEGLTVEGGAVTARLGALEHDPANSVLSTESSPQVTGGSLTLIDASLEANGVSKRVLSNGFRGKITVAHGPDDDGAYETDYNTAWGGGMPDFPYVRMEAIADHTQPTVYPVWVEGKQVTSTNAANVLGDETASVSYAAGTATLTLNDASITAPGGQGNRAEVDGAALYAAQNLTLSVTGDNTLTGAAVSVDGSTRSYGIYIYGRDLTVTGSGTLTAKGADAYYSYGIDTSSENRLTVDGGVVVTGIAGQGSEGAHVRGISASPTGESSVLVSASSDGTDLRALDGTEKLYNFPYGVVYNPVAQKLEIRRDGTAVTEDTLQIVSGAQQTFAYTAALLDQMGMTMSGDVTWTVSGQLPNDVTVNGGTVTVGSTAATGTFTLTAACGGKTASVVIAVTDKADAGVTISGAPTTITYGDDGITLSANAANPGTNGSWTWTSSDENVLQVTQGTDGSATVAVTGEGAADITASYNSDTTVGSDTVQLTVNPKAVTITGLTAQSKEYDGKTDATAAGDATLTGVVGDDDVTIANGSASFADKHVGTGKTVTFNGYSLTGTDADNYTLSAQPASVTADITPKTIGVTGLAATDRAYNGTTRVELTGGTLVDMIPGDNVALNRTNAYGAIADANVGDGKAVAVSGLTLSGADASNYTLSPVTGVTVDITKADAPSLTDVTVQQRYSETSGQASVAGVGMPAGAGTLSYATGMATTNGAVTVTGWSVDASGNVTYTLSGGAAGDTVTLPVVISSDNYEDATVNVAITLTEKNNQAPLTLSDAEMTYGGTLTLSAAGGSGTGEVTYEIVNGGNLATLNGNVLTATGVGTVTVQATKAGDSDYNEATATAIITIKKAVPAMTLSASPSSLTGGGAVTLTLTGAPGSVTVTCTSDSGITVTEVEGQQYTWTVTLPSGAKSYTFSAAYAGDDNHESAAATCTVTVRSSGGSTGGGSGSSGSTTYVPSVDAGRNGDVTVSPSRPSSGQTVTITVDPDAGYELDDLTVTDARGNVVKVTDNGDGTYSFTQPSSKVTIEATFAEIQEEPALAFTDVTERDYYYDAVLWAVENGITSGTTAATFSPDANVSRAQMVTFLWRAAGSPEPQSSVNPFTDISSSAYYYDAVLWAVENGITNGTSATTFGSESAVSRAQAVTFLWRSANAPAASGVSFDDVADEAYYAQAVAWAAQEGITSGTGGNSFSPDLIVSRAQAVTFLYRQLG